MALLLEALQPDIYKPARGSKVRKIKENHSLFLPFCKLLLRKAFFTYKLVPIWNILPANFVSTNVTKAFMNYLRTFDLSKFYRIS